MASVLAVDDSPAMRQVLAFALSGAGYEVVEAADEQEALGIARKKSVNLVITDANMPKMGGFSLIRQLRRLPGYQRTPMLMLTAESGTDRRRQGAQAGATGWIVKPFDPDHLLAVIKKALS